MAATGPRVTIRGLMTLVAVVAVAFALALEVVRRGHWLFLVPPLLFVLPRLLLFGRTPRGPGSRAGPPPTP